MAYHFKDSQKCKEKVVTRNGREGTQVSKVETNFIFMERQKPLEKQGKDFPTKGLQSRPHPGEEAVHPAQLPPASEGLAFRMGFSSQRYTKTPQDYQKGKREPIQNPLRSVYLSARTYRN